MMKGAQVVDAFALITALTDQILVDVRADVRVRVYPGGIRKHARETRGGCTGQACGNARLNNSVASLDAPTIVGDAGPIKHIGERLHHVPSAISWKLSIGIERDYEADAAKLCCVSDTKQVVLLWQ